MNKKDLKEHVALEYELKKKVADAIVDDIFQQITNVLAKGGPVQILGFGTWTVKKRAKRKGRNPYSGESIIIKAKKVTSFKPGLPLKKIVAEGKVPKGTKKAKAKAKVAKKAVKKAAPKKAVKKAAPKKVVKKAAPKKVAKKAAPKKVGRKKK